MSDSRIVRRVSFVPHATMRAAFSWPRDKQRHCRVISFRARMARHSRETIRNFFGEFLPQSRIPSRCNAVLLVLLPREQIPSRQSHLNSKTSYITFYILCVVYALAWFCLRHLNFFINTPYCAAVLRSFTFF